MDTQLEIESAGFPEDVETAIDAAIKNSAEGSGARRIADLLRDEVRKFGPKVYVRFRCSIVIEEGGSNE